jgi:peptidoglycan/LPS O-acetylase OafA/YrhL
VLAALIGHRVTGEHRPLAPWSNIVVSGARTLAGAALVVGFLVAPTSGATMYEGWYAIVAVAAAVLLAQLVVAPHSTVASALSSPPLVALGRISYSLYLWHWPLFIVLDEGHTGLTGDALFALRAIVSLVVATASYRFVEQRFHGRPARRREPGRALTVRVPRRAASTSVSGRGDDS